MEQTHLNQSTPCPLSMRVLILAVIAAMLLATLATRPSIAHAVPSPQGSAESHDSGVGAVAYSVNGALSLSAVDEHNLRDLAGLVVDGTALSGDKQRALVLARATYAANPSECLQYPELGSGCEIASLASALQSMGFDAKPTLLVDEFLEVDGDFERGYLESPYTDFDGGGFPPGIAKTANAYLAAQGAAVRAHDLTGSSFSSLRALTAAGYPVLVWTTIDQCWPDFEYGSGDEFDWYDNEHCMTLYAANDEVVFANDPVEGLVEFDTPSFIEIFEACDSHALAIW